MKLKVWTDSNNRLLNWAWANENRPVGPTDEGFEVIEVDEAIGLYENHASIVDGQVVPDADYDPDTARPTPEPSPEQQMLAALTLKVAQMEAVKSSD
ncbi:hypothetical protein [Lacticaseibacillus paracasei]|uniref:hypothetical protein n=1 Tax=Lacticaseibacillus paracasei TaxID=1597 RepID=UPI000BC2EEB1|nr:hypothetical protein [Lacticaseibacillus paracasei]ATG98889.1 hypothetical protein FAM18149p_05645 [Lacticaseibacillus paracasei]RND78224.1 hypothetical protein FAM18149_01082 [Lacticaseibacillus paracasei]RND85467.1 hypothetical protein FAM18168_01001 [Lacticaseibacillus paracasei]